MELCTDRRKQIMGLMLGGAIGDALGAPVEHKWIGTFPEVDDYQITSRFYQGEWTADTAMNLCVAESLLRCEGVNLEDQMHNFLKWHFSGYLGTRSYAKGEGKQTKSILNNYFYYKLKPREHDMSGSMLDGNGSLMRIGAIAAFYWDPRDYIDEKKSDHSFGKRKIDSLRGDLQRSPFARCSANTHNSILCNYVCHIMGRIIRSILIGIDKEKILKSLEDVDFLCSLHVHYWNAVKVEKENYDEIYDTFDALIKIMRGGYKVSGPEIIDPKGAGFAFVLNTMRVVLRGFYHFDTFEEGMKAVVNLGGDANTNACVYGYLAGAYYGEDAIPEKWKKNLMDGELIQAFGEALYTHNPIDENILNRKRYDLQRFQEVQEKYGNQACTELKKGHKTQKRQMFYCFPPIATIGKEEGQSKIFSLSCAEEVKEYLENDILRENLYQYCNLLGDGETEKVREIFDENDREILHSCMTVFHLENPKDEHFIKVLQKYFNGILHSNTKKIYSFMKEDYIIRGDVIMGHDLPTEADAFADLPF